MSSKLQTPPWPSLYDPSIDLLHIPHREPVQPAGHYLHDANDIFRFTLYWSLIFYLPIFVLAGLLAFLNIAFAPSSRHRVHGFADDDQTSLRERDTYPLVPLTSSPSSPTSPSGPVAPRAAGPTTARRTPPKVNPHRTRATYALLVLFTYLFSGLLGAVVGSAVLGYVLAGLYKAGGFFMSTWIPPLFALVLTLFGVLGIYPSVAEII